MFNETRSTIGRLNNDIFSYPAKNKMQNFNTDFEEMYRAQKSYAMPDQELRNQVLREVKQVLLPLYSRFVDKYQGTDFTKNPAKYIKYDRDQLERMINQFFEPSA